MALTFNLSDLSNQQLSAITGRKIKTPYTTALASMAPYARAEARQNIEDSYKQNVLNQDQTQFDLEMAQTRQIAEEQKKKAKTASYIQGAQTLGTLAYMTKDAWWPNLVKPAAAKVLPSMFEASTAPAPAADLAILAPAATDTAGLVAADALAGGSGVAEAAALENMAASGAGGSIADLTGIYAPSLASQAVSAVSTVAAPAAIAGYAVPKLIDTIHEDSMENLGHNITLGAVADEKTAADVGATVTGAGAGAVAGGFAAGAAAGASAMSWSGPGAIVGAAIGGIIGLVSRRCIIITACTSWNSREVNIARMYRDTYLDADQLRGYYCLAEKIVPLLERHTALRRRCKTALVDRLIDYGSYRLGLSSSRPKVSSWLVSKAFLALIKGIGLVIPRFVRQNGEVY